MYMSILTRAFLAYVKISVRFAYEDVLFVCVCLGGCACTCLYFGVYV